MEERRMERRSQGYILGREERDFVRRTFGADYKEKIPTALAEFEFDIDLEFVHDLLHYAGPRGLTLKKQQKGIKSLLDPDVYSAPLEFMLQWIINHTNLDATQLKNVVMRYNFYENARKLGATEQEIQHSKDSAKLFRYIQRFTRTQDATKLLRKLRRLKRHGYDFTAGPDYTYNALELFVHTRPPADIARPIIEFLIGEGINPFKGARPDYLSQVSSPELSNIINSVWERHQQRVARGEMAVREGRLTRGEFAPGQEIHRNIPQPYIKRAVYQARAKELCEDIREGAITPGELIGLAGLLHIDDPMSIPWGQLCDVVQEQINAMLI